MHASAEALAGGERVQEWIDGQAARLAYHGWAVLPAVDVVSPASNANLVTFHLSPRLWV